MRLKLYNSLTRKIEEFKPLNPPKVGIYTCGPTVYDYVTIGNWRTYILGDLLVRTLKYFGYQVDYIMNITDVGHLTGDNLGDASIGEDRMEKAAKREKKTAWDIAKFYTDDFLKGYEKLNLIKPRKFTKATNHIKEQIELVKKIEKRGFTYKTSDGIYFDVKLYEKAGNKYGQLSTLDKRKEGARVAKNPEKKDERDFALWKFSKKDEKRQMEWDSPWGRGFPGWHIECSAMGMKYLGEQFDIHVGGEDLRSTHHSNEIAQSEAATGKKPFVKHWAHGAFLLVDGGRMGKSLGNAYTLYDIEKRGFNPMHLRYFYLTGHYRKQLNFTWKALESAKNAYDNLVNVLRSGKYSQWFLDKSITEEQTEEEAVVFTGIDYDERFKKALMNDLQIPEVLKIMWDLLRETSIKDKEKKELILKWDEILGLNLQRHVGFKISAEIGARSSLPTISETQLPEDILNLSDERMLARKRGDYKKADEIRQTIEAKGFIVRDTTGGTVIEKK